MRPTFVLGRIAGVRIGVHWSVLLIFAVIALGLAEGRLPEAHPGHGWPAYWAAGILTAVVFFASLLAHELAHAIVARRNGVEVDDIVLWLLGGVARLKAEAPNPAAELRIAGVGPLVSLVLGGLFTLAAWLLDTTAAPGLAVEALAWLAAINILLAVFNVVPAAPLDGGRLLRAFLWWRTGDRLRATAGATAAGRAFGWFLTVVGLFLFVRGDVFGGLWLAMIGWFLVAAATMEGQQAQLRAVLAGIPVRQAMTPDPVTVPVGLTVAAFLADPQYRFRHSAFPVTGDGSAPVGLMTLDLARRVPEDRQHAVTVERVMLPLTEVTVVGADDPLADLLPRMQPGAEHRALVLDRKRLVGIVSASDVSRTVTWLMTSVPRGGGGGRGT
ncbi:site-2 protease family protein [Streptomyces gardneri]|uniref:Zinc metalloprotease n=1 Tax=Streptomyces gardneri TaxID=66892 RepID=A0A4Y3RIF3_9ACTN|nr:site-2 protease family protein [Streptomyces gardneri]GEB57435.1 putative zinc metalloprotease Rip3 [Streptomyces gardneri]GHH23762.1 zinc metalloprotease [Streptomyces gardneri]